MRPRAQRALAIVAPAAVAPTASAEWKPAGDRIKTRWAATVTGYTTGYELIDVLPGALEALRKG